MKRSLGILIASGTLGAFSAFAQMQNAAFVESPDGAPVRAYPYWTVFRHPRFGYDLPVPPEVRAVGVPEAVAEPKFVSPDGDFVMSAWGGVSPQLPGSLMETQWTLARNRPGRTITYQRKARTWFVVSGTDKSGREFYEKFLTYGDHAAGYTVTYPHARLREFEPWVEDIEDHFRVVTLPDGPAEIAPRLLPGLARSGIETSENLRSPGGATLQTFRSSTAPGGDPARITSRTATETKVDITPPPKRPDAEFGPTKLEVVKAGEADAVKNPTAKQTGAETTAVGHELPIGQKVVGRPGFVYSPFLTEKRLVDVADIAPGTKVKCPYTDKVFRVP